MIRRNVVPFVHNCNTTRPNKWRPVAENTTRIAQQRDQPTECGGKMSSRTSEIESDERTSRTDNNMPNTREATKAARLDTKFVIASDQLVAIERRSAFGAMYKRKRYATEAKNSGKSERMENKAHFSRKRRGWTAKPTRK